MEIAWNCLSLSLYIYIYLCIYIYMYIYIYVYVYVYIYIHTYIIIWLYNYISTQFSTCNYIYIYMYTYTDRYEIGLAWIFVITSRVVGWLWLLVDLCVGQLCRRIAAGKGALVISWWLSRSSIAQRVDTTPLEHASTSESHWHVGW